MRGLLLALLLTTPAYAEGVLQEGPADAPPPEFFTGVFERVGRDASDPPGLINDLLRITPTAEGWGLSLRPCDAVEGQDWPLELRHTSFGEVPNILEGKQGETGLWCQYFTDHSNYPVLTCASDQGARFTLWAVTDAREAACAP